MSSVAASAAAVPASTQAAAYLYPGQLKTSVAPLRITTIVGSCVAVCLWDTAQRSGGMNHFVLPNQLPDHQPSPRFAVVAMQELVRQVLAGGGNRATLVAKVFGGASMMAMQNADGGLGAKNVQSALTWLEAENITVVARSVGGVRGRKVVFQTADGSVLVREL